MAFSKTWDCSFNNAIAGLTAAQTWSKIKWLIKQIMMGENGGLSFTDTSNSGSSPSGGGWKMFWSCNGGGTTAGTNFGASTTIASASNGHALPQSTIDVASTSNFPASGTFIVVINNVPQVITYTGGGGGGTQFTGCTGGTGTLATNQVVVDNRDFYGNAAATPNTFDSTKMAQATAGSNHSWCVLYSPSSFGGTGQGPFYFVIDDATGSGTGFIHDFYLSKTAPASGTGTATPTATTKISLNTQDSQLMVNTAGTAYHVSGILSRDGLVRICWSQDGDGYITSVFRVDQTLSDSTDQWPIALLAYCPATTPGNNTWCDIPSTFSGNAVSGAVNGNGVNNPVWNSMNFDGSSQVKCALTLPAWRDLNTSTGVTFMVCTGANTGTNQTTKKWDQIPCVGLYAFTVGYQGFKGLLVDYWWWAGCRGVGATSGKKNIQDCTYDSTNRLMVIGDLGHPAPTQHVL